MFTIELLPAAHGDAIWIEYGPASQPHRILIDGGPASTYETGLRPRILALPPDQRTVDLLIVSHIDADHIDGSLILLQELDALKVKIGELWFNGWSQISDLDVAPGGLGPMQGEFLGALITVNPDLQDAWNAQFKGRAVVVRDKEPLRVVELADKARLTLLGPAETELRRLRARWTAALRDFSRGNVDETLRRLAARREYQPPDTHGAFGAPVFGDDRTPANGSSIACVFEYEGQSVLLAADAHARSLAESLQRLLADQPSVSRLHFDAVKLPHHGSMSNVSEAWLQLVDCERWLISTNGAVFGHPNVETAELIAEVSGRYTKRKPTLLCNYKAIADRLAEKTTPRWNAAFTENETSGQNGGLRLSLPVIG